MQPYHVAFQQSKSFDEASPPLTPAGEARVGGCEDDIEAVYKGRSEGRMVTVCI
jgi:hypothetical protein